MLDANYFLSYYIQFNNANAVVSNVKLYPYEQVIDVIAFSTAPLVLFYAFANLLDKFKASSFLFRLKAVPDTKAKKYESSVN